ncbi:MAG: DUF86 domain-containing protein [Gammaproteobacteria bacterium]|nr:DUF86 domain-containing protein [Gammaproteobacteria bacterium]
MKAGSQGLHRTDYLNHMLDAVRLVRSYTEGLGKTDFLEDRKTQQAVILNILVIGEAASKIADEFPEWVKQHPDVRWKDMRGMRNRMAHGYFDINLDVVWETVQQSLPALEQQLLGILKPGS